ncbi:MAG: tetratricopeptide repeat protein [Ignavibacteria bacterium]|nr:tetratricopeptide repeat protein [Ignavibacteria bacterium]
MHKTVLEIDQLPNEDPQELIERATEHFSQSRIEQALYFAESALAISRRINDATIQLRSLKIIGDITYSRGEYPHALDVFQDALSLSLSHNLPEFEAIFYGLIGNTLRNLGDFTAALQSQEQSLHLNQTLNNSNRIAGNLSNIANIYIALGNYPLALEYSTEALQLARETKNTLFEANILGNVGVIYNELKDFQQAFDYYTQATAIFEKLGNKSMLSIFYGNIGTLYSDLGEYSLAVDYYEKAMLLDEELGNKEGAARHLGNIGLMYSKEDFEGFDPQKAEDYLLPAITVFEELGSKQYALEGHQSLAQLFENTGNTTKAYFHLKRLNTLEKEILIEDAKKQAEQFDFERKIAAERARLEEREKVVTELQLLNSSLKEANREKNEVLGIVAHDLKNPITGIILSTDNIQRYHKHLTHDELDKQLSHIKSAAERMKSIVLNLLDIQLIESGRFNVNIQPISLDTILELCVAEFRSRAAEKEISISILKHHTPLTILADTNAFHEILDNLISNALKFSPNVSTVEIGVSVAENNQVRISVRDQGPGLTNDDKSKLFGKFMRLSARPTAGEHSTGLGLSIVKKLVEAMNGTIWCESEFGNGATFIVELTNANLL